MNYDFKTGKTVTAVLTVVFTGISIASMILKMEEVIVFIMCACVFFLFYLIINGIDKYGL
jgi:hypothetical protein